MKSHHEVPCQEETLSIEEILLVVSDVSERCWDVIEELRKEGDFSDTDFINLVNRIDSFKDHAVEASACLSTDEALKSWVAANADDLDRLIQRAARFLSSHKREPFARNFNEWHARLKEKDIKESEDCERFKAVTLATLSAVASIPGLLSDTRREEVAVLVEEINRLHKLEQALGELAYQFEEGVYTAKDVSDLLGYVAECAQLYCSGNLRSLLRMIDFSSEDFVNLADACASNALDRSESEVIAALHEGFSHLLERLRSRFLTRLREMWKVPSPEETAAA